MVRHQFNSADQNLIAQLLVRQRFLFSGLTLGSSLKPGLMRIVFTGVQSIRTTASKAVCTGTGPQIFMMIYQISLQIYPFEYTRLRTLYQLLLSRLPVKVDL